MTKQIHFNRSNSFGEIAGHGEAFVGGIAKAASALQGPTAALVDRFKAWNDKRLTNAALDALNDHMLQDIGLKRLEIDYFVSDPHNYDRRLRLYVER